MNGPALTCEMHALVEHYEALREDILDPNGHGQRVHGLALLVRKGMAAWMKGVSEHSPNLISSVPSTTALPLPSGVEQPLVDILAAMALATAWEVQRDCRDSLESASPAPQRSCGAPQKGSGSTQQDESSAVSRSRARFVATNRTPAISEVHEDPLAVRRIAASEISKEVEVDALQPC